MTQPRRLTDPMVGAWVNERLSDRRPTVGQVGMVVPAGFAAVVRVLHPAGDGRTWAEVAAANGTTIHPLAQWFSIDPLCSHTARLATTSRMPSGRASAPGSTGATSSG